MNKPSVVLPVSALVALAGMTSSAGHAAPLSLATAPLTVSTAVEPNVMLLIDNSGSMNNMVWADSYDNATEYPNWQYYGTASGAYWNDWRTITKSDGGILLSFVTAGSCASGYKSFTAGSTTKCLKLPDPVGGGETRYTGNYLNYLLQTYANGTDLTTGQIPTAYRMQVARDVTTSLVEDTSGMRFGVTRFNNTDGGTVTAACGSATSTLTTKIAALTASTWTPLAESLYEVTRYFRGMNSQYSSASYTSPIQYRCQKNFTIVVTDGLPTYDTNIPTDDPADTADTSHALPDWDGQHPDTTQAMSPIFPKYSDGFQPQGNESNEGYSLYLDDIAKFAWDIDFKTSGTDNAGASYEDPKFAKQNMYTYTVGFSTANQMLQDAAEYGHGEYYTASNASQLGTALQHALADILAKSGSSASAAANAGFLGTDTKVYQARFNSADWSGQLLAFQIDSDPSSATYGQPETSGPGPSGALWDAGAKLPGWDSRNIFTVKSGAGVPFRWDDLDGSQQTALGNSNVLEYLRGNGTLEGTTYRSRATKLGDIVNSAPVFVGAPAYRYPDTLEISKYSLFMTTYKSRTKMIYVGANDGMLHGFNADTGVEKMAYVPGPVFGSLSALSSKTYAHRYYVDGSPTVVDAFVGGAWKTMLVGGLNRGGQGVYALDVTDPASFSESATNASHLLRWEFTDASDPDLGYTYSRPAIVRLPSGEWAAVFGNGYNNTEADGRASATGDAVLYIVNLTDGSIIAKIDTGVGMSADPTGAKRPNGLATVAPVDLDGDQKVDAIYAGDLFGNLWKFAPSSSGTWGSAFKTGSTPKPLFTACSGDLCTSSNHQPITVRPEVGRQPGGSGVLVYFGTGQYMETGDNNGAAGGRHSFYAILDNGSTVSGRNTLVQQQISLETSSIRVVTNNTVDGSTKRGWYLDLVPPSGTWQGERQVTDPLLRNGRIIFTTIIPANDPCVPGGPSWLMELNAATGARLSYSPFDVNGDGTFDTSDFVTITEGGKTIKVPVAATKTDGGAAATPTVMACQGAGCERKFISSSDGLQTVTENPGAHDAGRQSWRQLGL